MGSRSSDDRPQSTRSTQRYLVVALAASFAVSAIVAAAQTADRARTESLARRAEERLQTLRREADRLASDERTLLNELRKLEVEREIKSEELKQLSADAAQVETQLADTTARMDALQHAEAEARPELRARLVEIYKLGQARYVRLLLSAGDLRRIGEASRTVAALAKLDRDRIASHRRMLADLEATRATLEVRQKQLASLRAQAEKARGAADRAAQARTDLIHDIDGRRDLNAQLAGELQAAQMKLQLALRDISSGATAAEVELPLKPFRGALDWPTAGTVVRRFGRPVAGRGSSNGVEISAPEGADVHAIHDGVVAFADAFGGFGNLVIIDHGGQAYSLYGNLLEIRVKKGGRVDRGQTVGTVGATPAGPTGLYFELRVDGQPVDPLQWLKRR